MGGGKHYWPVTQAARLLCCDLSCSSVLDFGFQVDNHVYPYVVGHAGPPLWSSGQSFWLQIQRSRVRFPALPDFSE